MDKDIHVAITRAVKPGLEEAFEQAIQDFFTRTSSHQGSLGAQLIRPVPGSTNNTYGILRSFKSEADRLAFYQSEDFLKWQEEVESMVEGEYTRKDLHGLEAFFADPTILKHPPKWKMAFVTWLGVWPTVFIITQFLSPYLRLPVIVGTAADTFLVVVMLSWLVMPMLTKLFRPWLVSETIKS